MPGAIAIGLLIVVWIFVLTPWLLRRQKPIRKAGEAFDDTRVVYEGGSGELRSRRRPRISPADIHSSRVDDGSSSYEMVDAEEYGLVDGLEATGDQMGDPLIADEVSQRLDSAFSTMRSKFNKNATRTQADVVEGEVVHELPLGNEASTTKEEVVALEESSVSTTGLDDEENSYYEVDDSYTDADEFLLAEHRTLKARGLSEATDQDDELSDQEESLTSLREDDIDDDASANNGGLRGTKAFRRGVVPAHEELSEEEIEFAQRRKGRGGWDPEADQLASDDRYRRRKRTLIGLSSALVVTLGLGFFLGGWAWALPIIVASLTVVYLYALRQQVAAEERLRARRIQQLRRARLGVRNKNDEALGIPQRLRRPGAVVLEIDDDSPDFEELDFYAGPVPGTDSDSTDVADVREVDFRNGRRAG